MPSPSDIGGTNGMKLQIMLNDNFYFIDMDKYSLESVLRKGAELVKRKGIKCLVIDPYNKVEMLTQSLMMLIDTQWITS